MGAVVAVLILFVVFGPSQMRSRSHANEAFAEGAMRTISTAEIAFQAAGAKDEDGDGVGDYGTLEELYAVDPWPAFTGKSKDYVFEVDVILGDADTTPTFKATARPQEYGRKGRKSYYVGETGVIRFESEDRPATSSSVPLN